VLYFDTSFLTPLIREEATSRAVVQFIAGLPSGSLAVSYWTRVEFSSLLARDVRMGALEPQAAKEADAQFEMTIQETFVTLLPNTNAFNLAKRYIANYSTGLRAGDALHLGIASSHHAETIYSLDKKLLKAGTTLGLPMSAGIESSQS
jgi:predicted nucleic acid-binding protein